MTAIGNYTYFTLRIQQCVNETINPPRKQSDLRKESLLNIIYVRLKKLGV
jgi:hypothetical protein